MAISAHVAAFSQVREPAASLVAEGMNKESLLICNSQNWIYGVHRVFGKEPSDAFV